MQTNRSNYFDRSALVKNARVDLRRNFQGYEALKQKGPIAQRRKDTPTREQTCEHFHTQIHPHTYKAGVEEMVLMAKKVNMKHLKAIVRGRRCVREFEVSPVKKLILQLAEQEYKPPVSTPGYRQREWHACNVFPTSTCS